MANNQQTPPGLPPLSVGGDPRNVAEFGALRNEINKINHPARPEVDWPQITELAANLFEHHGVDLQTAVYYTVARSHTGGLKGFTEGVELLATLIADHWSAMWPAPATARLDILDWFNGRVGSCVRQYPFDSATIPLAKRAEQALRRICDTLQQAALPRASRIENLLYFMQETIKQLEAPEPEPAPAPKPVAKPKPTPPPPPEPLVIEKIVEVEKVVEKIVEVEKLVEVEKIVEVEKVVTVEKIVEVEKLVEVEKPIEVEKLVPAPGMLLRGAATGILLCLLVAAIAYFSYIQPMAQQLASLRQNMPSSVQLWQQQPELAEYGAQLDKLASLTPLATLQWGDSIVAQARQKWPTSPVQMLHSLRWEQLLADWREQLPILDSYSRVKHQLWRLSRKLRSQEQSIEIDNEVTTADVITALEKMERDLTSGQPLDALLWQLSESIAQKQAPSPQLISQINTRWLALLSQYHELMLRAEKY
ncbi:type VI secretion system ImpA family N-terminal domain-containing protein [Serratia microhaemolytica]|uniref:type VI secretion system ImpA family N-terminal domain-containing protein n=1 Tax=Serratia microhaemolytica TaxID=2675110 RepID=UPI000FDD522F|nr:type VI secretion system ImpA family N-terminal domain-containing protein [Serratia microhaemolytica]